MKFIPEDSQIILREVPDEISLSINISNCPHDCKGCHSPYLKNDIGEELTLDAVERLIERNFGISCICFLGGDRFHKQLYDLIHRLRMKYDLKFALYSGDDEADHIFDDVLDYYKIGHYDSELGPLDSKTTNQRLYEIVEGEDGNAEYKDITFKFWNKTL